MDFDKPTPVADEPRPQRPDSTMRRNGTSERRRGLAYHAGQLFAAAVCLALTLLVLCVAALVVVRTWEAIR